jgi:signal transduction histidine kinase
MLERIFFHDLLNTANGMLGYAELLDVDKTTSIDDAASAIRRLVGTLVDEIRAQRELSAAEDHELVVHFEALSSRAILTETVTLYRNHDAARDRTLEVDADSIDVSFWSDRTLLLRVLGNMVKNALEASAPGQVATIGCAHRDAHVEFWVHNSAMMPRDVQLQVFQRSFSTRGPGRGLGTYSIRLLTERYLRGIVSFSSTADAGTIFRVRYPCTPSDP